MQPTQAIKAFFTLTALILCGLIRAQTINYAHGPEQDCVNAIHLNFNGTFYYDTPYEGNGSISELNPDSTCLSHTDENSAWFKICIANPGELNFCVRPDDGGADYNFAVYNLTNASCSEIYTNPALEVRCNSSPSTFPSNCTGTTSGGMPQDELLMPVQTGDIYYILVSRREGDGMQGGFSVDCMYTVAGIIGTDNCSAPLSIGEKPIQALALYPNPAGNTISITIPGIKNQAADIRLFNASGQLVKVVANVKQQENTIDIANLAVGLYYYTVTTVNGFGSGKFAKE